MAPPLRLGLIGAGRWGRNYIKTIAGLEALRLAALASGNPASGLWVPQGCSVDSDWRAILDRHRIDAVIVATPPTHHAQMARAAVEAGLPVLVEKPLTQDLAEAIALREFVADRNGFVMVDHTHLFHPAYRKLRELAREQGPVRFLQGEAGNHGPFRRDTPVLWDWGPHDVAMCLDLLRTVPERVLARRTESRPVDDALGEIVELELFFAADVWAKIRIGNLIPKRRWFAAHFDRAVLVYDDLALHKLTLHPPSAGYAAPEGAGQPVAISADLPLASAVRDFAAAVRRGARDLSALDFGVSVVETLSRCAAALSA